MSDVEEDTMLNSGDAVEDNGEQKEARPPKSRRRDYDDEEEDEEEEDEEEDDDDEDEEDEGTKRGQKRAKVCGRVVFRTVTC